MINQDRLSVYKDETAKYTKRDAVHALLFAAYVYLLFIGFWITVNVFDVSRTVGQLFGVLVTLVVLLPLSFIVIKKGQGLHSLGLSLINWAKAIGAGLFFVVAFLMFNRGLLPGLLGGWQFQPTRTIAWLVVYGLIMAFWEDVVHIGYIQTRIYGLIKKDKLAILVGSLMFAAFHYPLIFAANIVNNRSFGSDFWIDLLTLTFTWATLHIAMNAVFRRFYSIIPVTLLHFSINFSHGNLWVDGGGNGLNRFVFLGITVLLVLTVTVFLPFSDKKRNVIN